MERDVVRAVLLAILAMLPATRAWSAEPVAPRAPEVRGDWVERLRGRLPEPSTAISARIGATANARSKGGQGTEPDGVWVEIGPTPAYGEPMSLFGLREDVRAVTGRVTAIAIHPEDARRWLVGGAEGGVWETRDAGRTWRPLMEHGCALAIGSIAIGPRSSGGHHVIYVGTGDPNPALGIEGLGLFRSTTDGRSWERVTSHKPRSGADDLACGGGSPFDGLAINRIAVSPTDPFDVVIAVTHARILPLFTSSTWKSYGIWRCNQMACFTGTEQVGRPTDLLTHPNEVRSGYAGLTWVYLEATGPQIVTGPRSGLYRRFAESDGWQIVHGPWVDEIAALNQGQHRTVGIGYIRLASPRNLSDVMFVSVSLMEDLSESALPEFNIMKSSRLLGVWRTRNAWERCKSADPMVTCVKWEKVDVKETDGGLGVYGFCGAHPESGVQMQCYHDHVLSAAPDRDDVVYGGGIALWKGTIAREQPTCPSEPEQKCRALATTWEEVSHMVNRNPRVPRILKRGIHADQQAMAWDPSGKRLVVGNDGGVWSTTNGGDTWQEHNHGLRVMQFWGGAVENDGRELTILAGAQDNGTLLWAGRGWRWVKGGDGVGTVLSTSAPRDRWALLYQSSIEGGTRGIPSPVLRRTLDGGKTFLHAETGIVDEWSNQPWVKPMVKCVLKDGSDVLFLGLQGLWRSDTFFSSATSPAWRRQKLESPPTNTSRTIQTIAIPLSERPGELPARCATYGIVAELKKSGTTSSEIQLTSDGGENFRRVDLSTLPPLAGTISALAIDTIRSTSPIRLVLYITVGGFDGPKAPSQGHVYRAAVQLDEASQGPVPASWVRADTGINVPMPHYAIALRRPIEPQGTIDAFVGTEIGILQGRCTRDPSRSDVCTWVQTIPRTHCLPFVRVVDVKVTARGSVVAFSHGRGAFEFLESRAGKSGWCGGASLGAVGTNFSSCSTVAGWAGHIGLPCAPEPSPARPN